MPWYTLHKIDAGLRDAALLRLADSGVVACRPLSDAAFEAMPETEQGGMNEVYGDLSATTGNTKYRTLAERFSHKALLLPLARGRDHLDGPHANMLVPKIIGFRRVHDAPARRATTMPPRFYGVRWLRLAPTTPAGTAMRNIYSPSPPHGITVSGAARAPA